MSPAAATADVAATKACGDRFRSAGIDLSAYNTKENAADLADLRVALGIPSWNMYGVSYGTKLALVSLRDHPEGIRSMIVDSVSPPNFNIAKEWWSAPAESFKAIFAACRAQPACATAFPSLEADFFATVEAARRVTRGRRDQGRVRCPEDPHHRRLLLGVHGHRHH